MNLRVPHVRALILGANVGKEPRWVVVPFSEQNPVPSSTPKRNRVQSFLRGERTSLPPLSLETREGQGWGTLKSLVVAVGGGNRSGCVGPWNASIYGGRLLKI